MKSFYASAGALLTFAFSSSPAIAAGQIMSGVYALNYTSTCAATVFTPTDASNGDVQSVLVESAGSASTLIGLATFDPSRNLVSFVGQSSGTGGLLQVSTTANGASPVNSYNTSVSSGDLPFFNSSTGIFLPFITVPNPNYTASYIVNPSTSIARIVTFSQVGVSPVGLPCVSSGYLAR